MLKLHQVTATPEWWRRLEQFPDRLTFHTQAWIRFLADTQHATPVFAEVRASPTCRGGLRCRLWNNSPFKNWVACTSKLPTACSP